MHKNQLSLFKKIGELPSRKVAVAAYAGESYILQFLGIALVLCVCAYLYFVGVSIMNVISNREASVESERLRSVVGNLEQEYFELAKSVTPEMGPMLGLGETVGTSFVRRASAVAANVTPSDI